MVDRSYKKALDGRLENREKVQIYKDKWIPKPIAMTFKPILSPLLHRDASVAEMIDFENQWNENLIRQHFLKEDAERFLKSFCLEGQRMMKCSGILARKDIILLKAVIKLIYS